MVIISTQDWDDLPTRKHRFARRYASLGCKVLYVEAQWHWLTYLRNRHQAVARLRRAGRPPRQIEPGLWLWTPPVVMPFFQMVESVAFINNRRVLSAMRNAIEAVAPYGRILLCTYTPYNADIIQGLQPAAAVYECVDDFAASSGLIRPNTVRRLERKTMERVQACIVTAQALYDQRRNAHENLHLIPNAADVEHFALAANPDTSLPADLEQVPRPRLGFIGGINYWIDLKLVAHVAKARPDWQIVLVGPRWVSKAGLREYENVHWLGRQKYDKLPSYLAGFDCCINPYILDDVAKACSPLKLYEYLASEKPVVSVPMPEAMQFAPPIFIGHSYNGFVDACESALGESLTDGENRRRLQRKLASANTWDERFERTLEVWKTILA